MSTTTPWVEKYRPSNFDEVVGNTKTVQILSNLVSRDVPIPNLLICGPPGCGKTVCVDILCDRVIAENRGARVLRSSSFDDRGIDSVRTTIKNFARGRVKTDKNAVLEKIVVLDEADSIASGAFQALRRIMDVYSGTTRFIIVCNNSSKIIEPIQSRCAILRFSKVEDEAVHLRMSQICNIAGVEYTTDGICALSRVADGDVRTAINSLSSTVSAFLQVTEANVYRTCDTPRPATVAAIVELLRDKNNFVRACAELKVLCDDGYCPSDIVSIFFKTLSSIHFEESQRLGIAKAVGLAQARVSNGSSTYLQLASMLWDVSIILS